MNAETAKINRTEHRVTVRDREGAEISGVTDVISFDEQTVMLDTVCGKLAIEGASLHIHVLDIAQGTVVMDGRVDALTYYQAENKEKDSTAGFFGRLFR